MIYPLPDEGISPAPKDWTPTFVAACVNDQKCLLWQHDKLGTLGFAVGGYSSEEKNVAENNQATEDLRNATWVASELLRLGRNDDLRKMNLLNPDSEYARSDGTNTWFEKIACVEE